jgi:hypothetical protein
MAGLMDFIKILARGLQREKLLIFEKGHRLGAPAKCSKEYAIAVTAVYCGKSRAREQITITQFRTAARVFDVPSSNNLRHEK